MASSSTFYDPLTINLERQTQILLEQKRENLPIQSLKNVQIRTQLLDSLSGLLSTPGLTIAVATAFRPILLDLCSRWLTDGGDRLDQLEALCLLLEIHPEIYPVLSAYLQQPDFEDGPLGFVSNFESISAIDAIILHRILLAYYRILHANRDLPRTLSWPLIALSKLIWTPHPDNGVRFLAIRCYALQTGMMECERVKMEKEAIGDVAEVDCPISYGVSQDGSSDMIDGWIMPAIEVTRVVEARNAHLQPQNYYTYEDSDSIQPIHPAELSPCIVNVHGILMFRVSGASPTTPVSKLIDTPTTIEALRTLAAQLSLGVPALLTSPPSSGKALMISHLASILFPTVQNKIITIHLADTSLDPRSLLGSYVSSTTRPGTFEWKEGVLVRAMREGKWVVFEDIDRGSNEVLSLIKPLVESLGIDKWMGGRANLEVPGRGRVEAQEGFAIFATRSIAPSRNGKFAQPAFYGAHKFYEMIVSCPTHQDLRIIVDARFPRLAGLASEGLIRLWEAVRALGTAASTRDIGMRELEKLCMRVDNLLPSTYQAMDVDLEPEQSMTLPVAFPNITFREDIYFEARDVLFGAGTTTASARSHVDAIAVIVAEHLGLTPERRDWVLQGKIPEFQPEKDVNGSIIAVRLGRTRLVANSPNADIELAIIRPFAIHKPAVLLMSRLATAISLGEPVLLTGETGTGKTSVITYLASLLRKPLISLNLSNQTESSDIIGGFKPVDARVPASELQRRFLDLFGGTFSRKRNAKFEESVRKAVQEGKWKRAVALWIESARLAKERIQARLAEDQTQPARDGEGPRKRRKMERDSLNVSEDAWDEFERNVRTFEIQHVQGNGKFAFGFVEGPLVKALRLGHWILLDEVNLASPETLECISGLLHGPTASITLTEQGSLEPVERHPDFRLFACMNPATDVGKKDLLPNIRSRFSEIDVPPPDADKETLLSIVNHYIGPYAVGDRGAIMDVAEFYTSVRKLAEGREIADGSNHRPHFSMRTLARALTFAADMASTFSLRRALWEGCLMAFTMILDKPSSEKVTLLAQKHILSGVRNPRSLLSKEPSPPQARRIEEFVKFGPFYLERGPLPEDPAEDYITTPSVETKLIDLARIIVTRRFPVLIEGPTSSGKTSSIEYLAKRTGHRFVRINNHEHTDIQEYLGTYLSDPTTGKLVFKDGLLVRALRNGDWIVLDELNLAPTDVLEALNRLLDDNRELVIPETQEVLRPHPHFMLFATQNPPGLYAGRKVLSRAFRNRFLEVHFEDVPQAELETILCQRCRIAPSYGQRIVSVFQELQKRRQSSRIFESKQGFATLRDLFRWAGRDAIDYQELADNGYMLLAERARKSDDKAVVKEVIESIMKVRIDETRLYSLFSTERDLSAFLSCSVPQTSQLVWTSAMQRLFILVTRALRFNEPVLLVGETGTGKTSVCQLYAHIIGRHLHAVSCHQNTETADLIGGLRPFRNRAASEAEIIQDATVILTALDVLPVDKDIKSIRSIVDALLKSTNLPDDTRAKLMDIMTRIQHLSTMFRWYDGPLIDAMRKGDVFLLDEISLADDSVLERLNSVLEPSRAMILAERGGDELELPVVTASETFKLVATMNPGGDYGKKELSPALRNRFTEIWVPPVDNRRDLEQIVHSLWRHEALQDYTAPLLEFGEWLSHKVSDPSVVTLRDILAWVEFSNATYDPTCDDGLSASEIFHHAASMTFLDGLGSLPQLSSYSALAIKKLGAEALSKLQEIVPATDSSSDTSSQSTSAQFVQLGTFSIPRGPQATKPNPFSFQAPTTRDNVSHIVRACQLSKPILLEGSPGVGKTSLVAALANICGYDLCRINLSDQTDLVDLFGSDLPVEGTGPGQFAWKDAEFLRAMQEGHWVLLDEMNLAPQAILEGLNAVLDHRGSVYIPELGRTFTKHPSFRIFAAQNPLHQGGGRKGLPKSFLNRFTKVYIQELTSQDVLAVCHSIFPEISTDYLRGMIQYTSTLHEEVMVKRTFGREGAPWEFNLRDVMRWGSLIRKSQTSAHPGEFLHTIFLHRFRAADDRARARLLFETIFSDTGHVRCDTPRSTVTPSLVQFGQFYTTRTGFSSGHRPGRVFHTQVPTLESIGMCLENGWLSIVTGPHSSGKTSLIRLLAYLTGRPLREINIHNATDANDLLGSFEEVDTHTRAMHLCSRIKVILDQIVGSHDGSKLQNQEYHTFMKVLSANLSGRPSSSAEILGVASRLLTQLQTSQDNIPERPHLISRITELLDVSHVGRFEWLDGPLVQAMKDGCWVLLDGANLCNPSVLDRLNSLCEIDGCLTLNERGAVDGQVQAIKPHPNFRLFMCIDVQYGELSRAMRNRGIEVFVLPSTHRQDQARLWDHHRLPSAYVDMNMSRQYPPLWYEFIRRGTVVENPSFTLHTINPTAQLLGEDSASDMLIDMLPLVGPQSNSQQYPSMYFVIQSSIFSYLPILERFIGQLSRSGAMIHYLEVIIHDLSQSHAISVTTELREELRQMSKMPSNLLQAQPMDLMMHRLSFTPSIADSNAVNLNINVLILRLLVSLCKIRTRLVPSSLPEIPLEPAWHSSLKSTGQERVLHEATLLIRSIYTAGQVLCDTSRLNDSQAAVSLTFALRLVAYAHYLGEAMAQGVLDYSAVQATCSWLIESFREYKNSFAEVEMRTQALADAISLTSGLGLAEIWMTMSSRISVTHITNHTELEVAASDLPPAVRSHVLELMALQTLPTLPGGDERQVLITLKQQLETRFAELPRTSQATRGCIEDPLFVVTELGVLSMVPVLDQDPWTEDIISRVQELLDIACHDPHSSLFRLSRYLHLIWATRAAQPALPIVARLYLEWFSALWEAPLVAEVNGPLLICIPIELHSTVQLCDWTDRALQSRRSYESSLHRQAGLISLRLDQPSRLFQMYMILSQSILMVLVSFRNSFGNAEFLDLRITSCESDTQCQDWFSRLLTAMQGVKHEALREAFHQYLTPALRRLKDSRSEQERLVGIGGCWIGLSRLMLQLFIPNVPIDPAALQHCYQEFWENEKSILSAQIDMHMELEARTTGQDSNGTIRYLRTMRDDAISRLVDNGPGDFGRRDVARLHVYWSEVHQFLKHVTSPAKIGVFTTNSHSDDAMILTREGVMQESITAFCQRLSTVYPDVADINTPIQLALGFMKFGLRLSTHRLSTNTEPSSKALPQIVSALLAHPSVKSAELLRRRAEAADSHSFTFTSLITTLAALSYESSIGIDVCSSIAVIQRLYQQVHGLWLIDRARNEEKERESQSLYRKKNSDSDALNEAEIEEQEFLSIFPEFGDLMDGSISPDMPTKVSNYVDSSSTSRLFDVHLNLFLPPVLTGDTSGSAYSSFANIRGTLLQTILKAHTASLPQALDQESTPYQITLLYDRLTRIENSCNASMLLYDFYFDDNVPEVKKAAIFLEGLQSRLESLILEWPDQMVLQHLKARCDAILNLTLRSPVAKILSSLEQLLLQSEDWEMFAHRDNSIKQHQQALTGLIVEWRRLELSSWKDLLETQARTFQKGASDWWFRLYDLTIWGLLKAVDEAEMSDDTVDEYLDNLVPLLNEFMAMGPIGQYRTRLHLLHSMENYAALLASHECGGSSAALRRVHHILHSSRQYYAHFEPRIATSLAEQRLALEKDIQGFIKLASWRDVNVHALKQSAQKTHRQLFRCIRKFREVLRQPVSDMLHSLFTEDKADSAVKANVVVANSLNPVEPDFPEKQLADTARPAHLANLRRTYQNYGLLIGNRITMFIKTHSPEHVEDMANEIITTMHSLAMTTVPATSDPARKGKLLKNLLSRKRKAWSDMLKELKRGGLAANVKPEVLTRQNNLRWLREQPVLLDTSRNTPSILKVEDYLQRLIGALPQVRASLSDHHGDLPTRELHRGVMMLESAFALALHSRSQLADSLEKSKQLKNLSARLHSLSLCPDVVATGSSVALLVETSKATAFKLVDALQEMSKQLCCLRSLQPSVVPSASTFSAVDTFIQSLQATSKSLSELLDNVMSTRFCILLRNELGLITKAQEQFEQMNTVLRQWSGQFPRLRRFLDPISTWLADRPRHELSREHTQEASVEPEQQLIDSLLVTTQSMLTICSEPDGMDTTQVDEPPDHYIREGCRTGIGITTLLRLGQLLQDLECAFPRFVLLHSSDLQTSLARYLPFLNKFLVLVEIQVLAQSDWTKSLFKLTFVLCSIMRAVSKDGFCQPKETEEGESDQGGGEPVEGAGLGEGTGTENVSKEIQDESQVEGLQGEDVNGDEDVERADEGSAIEMSEDFGGKLQDVAEAENEDDSQSDDGSELDPEDQLDHLDASDETTVDEKLWGDESSSHDRDKTSGKSNKDDSQQESSGSEIAAKDDEQSSDKRPEPQQNNTATPQDDVPAEPATDDADPDEEGQEADVDGAPLDDFVQNSEILDLPDEMELDFGKDAQQQEIPINEDDSMNGTEQEEAGAQPDTIEQLDVDAMDNSPNEVDTQEAPEELPAPENVPEEVGDTITANPDIHGGDGNGDENTTPTRNADTGAQEMDDVDSASRGQTEGTQTVPQTGSKGEETAHDWEDSREDTQMNKAPEDIRDNVSANSGAAGTQDSTASVSSQVAPQRLQANPLRSLGDALREIAKRFDDILDSDSTHNKEQHSGDATGASQLEYVREDDTENEMQALGPAGQEEVAKLSELKLVDEDQEIVDQAAPMDGSDILHKEQSLSHPHLSSLDADATSSRLHEGLDSALTPAEIQSRNPSATANGVEPSLPSDEITTDKDHDAAENLVELQLREWQAKGQPTDDAERIWRLYESLTHDLSYALCEQLRLILEPTLATRLKGDYRTGKRLNMKKIIPYIASEYTKDKIWLRRTRPSQREYQVLVALDDSRSMAESHSVHLAYQTLALVSKALSRLEVGDIAIAKFGESVEVLHGFDSGPFTDQAGTKIMDAFRFDQKATQVLSLIETSLTLLEQARQRRSMSSQSASDLWQMEIIISDGICQDHERLRTILRKAEEQRVMVVFIILDSLHSTHTSGTGQPTGQNSILSMNQVAYKDVDGRMDLTVTRYLDTFPFEYYVVVRNVEALPDVLSSTLKQFFERISED